MPAPAEVSTTAHVREVLTSASTVGRVRSLLCRIADYLDQTGLPIDYQRRREHIPAETIQEEGRGPRLLVLAHIRSRYALDGRAQGRATRP